MSRNATSGPFIPEAQRFLDAAREAEIERQCAIARDPSIPRPERLAAHERMSALIAGRSAEQIQRMERARGLTP